jgi:hypothetical protein
MLSQLGCKERSTTRAEYTLGKECADSVQQPILSHPHRVRVVGEPLRDTATVVQRRLARVVMDPLFALAERAAMAGSAEDVRAQTIELARRAVRILPSGT